MNDCYVIIGYRKADYDKPSDAAIDGALYEFDRAWSFSLTQLLDLLDHVAAATECYGAEDIELYLAKDGEADTVLAYLWDTEELTHYVS